MNAIKSPKFQIVFLHFIMNLFWGWKVTYTILFSSFFSTFIYFKLCEIHQKLKLHLSSDVLGNCTCMMSRIFSFSLSPFQGGAECEYCRITRADIKNALGFHSFSILGSKSTSRPMLDVEKLHTFLTVKQTCFHFKG